MADEKMNKEHDSNYEDDFEQDQPTKSVPKKMKKVITVKVSDQVETEVT